MPLVTASYSFRALMFTGKVSSGNSSSALDFGPLNSASTSTIRGGRSEFSVAEYSVCGKHDFSRRMWPSSSLLARRERKCNVRVNAGSPPESQATDTEVDSSSSQGESRRLWCTSLDLSGEFKKLLFWRTRPSAQSHLVLLQRLTSESSFATAGSRNTIAEQLKEDLELEGGEEVTIPLGCGKLDIQATDLTISQKRNIARQKYLDKVSQRNDALYFTAVALFELVPPIAILGVAVATGFVDLFP